MNKLASELKYSIDCALKNEYEAAYFYESLVVYFCHLGLDGFANFFRKQVEEERAHIVKLTDYLINTREHLPTFYDIAAPPATYSSPLDCFHLAQEKELAILSSFKSLIENAEFFQDEHLKHFLIDFFLDEQYKSIAELNKHIQILSKFDHSFVSTWFYDWNLKFD